MNNTSESNSRGCIYRINFGNGQYYIGQTLRTPEKRYNNDVAKYGSNEQVRHAAATYGYDIEVLGYYDNLDHLNEVEELAVDMCLDDVNCLNSIRGGANSGGNGMEVTLIGPDGSVYHFKTQSVAARHIGVTSAKVSDIVAGKRLHTKGWRLPGTKSIEPTTKYVGRGVTLISPEGEEVYFKSHSEARRHIGSKSGSSINRLMDGRINHVKGWTIK